jgi:parallel beta-helix repeat protein
MKKLLALLALCLPLAAQQTTTSNATISNNTIHDTNNYGIVSTAGSVGGSSNVTISGNTVFNTMQTNSDGPGIGTWLGPYSGGTGNVINGNTVYSGGSTNGCSGSVCLGSGINVDNNSAPTTVSGNVVYGNNYGCINLTASGHHVYGNTCYNNNVGVPNDAGEISIFQASGGVVGSSETIENNILFATSGASVLKVGTGSATGHVIDYNLYFGGASSPFSWSGTAYSFSGYKTAASEDGHSLSANPLFTNAGSNIFTLAETSPARNSGTPISGYSFPYGASDLGAISAYQPQANTLTF